MENFIGLYVVKHRETDELQYQSRQMFMEELPTNCQQDIMDCIALCNSQKLTEYKDFDYVDMYGIIVDGETQWWEIED